MNLHKVIRHLAYGASMVGTLNGLPPVADLPDTQLGTAYREGTDANEPQIKCYRGKDGSEFWRHPGYGSV